MLVPGASGAALSVGTGSSANPLPHQFSPLIGREKAVAAVLEMLRLPQTRLVTLVGPGGVGKTRLALQVAAELVGDPVAPGGVSFVELADIRDPALVIPTIASTLAVSDSGTVSPLAFLLEHLSGRAEILVLDNLEQVPGAFVQLGELLTGCPSLRLLVTSRVPLRLRGEREYPVAPLRLPDLEQLSTVDQLAACEAVRLYVERAREIQPEFLLTSGNSAAVAEICVRLDGLPLAIELAAARVKLLTPQSMLARLEQRLPLLTGGARDMPMRQQTLRDTIAWSYDLLESEEQTLFRRLAVFVGGWTLEAAEAICAPGMVGAGLTVVDALDVLVRQSLVLQGEQPDGSTRFTMLGTIGEFALDALAADPERLEVQRRHASYFLSIVDVVGPEGVISDALLPAMEEAVERIEPDVDNLRAALSWTLDRHATEPELLRTVLRGSPTMIDIWRRDGRLSEGRRWIAAALQRTPGAIDRDRGTGLGIAAYLAVEQGDYAHAHACLDEGLAISDTLDDLWLRGGTLLGIGRLAFWQGDLSRSMTAFEELSVLGRQLGIQGWQTVALEYLAGIAREQRDFSRAVALLEEALAIDQELGGINPYLLTALGDALLRQGNLARSRLVLTQSLQLIRPHGRTRSVADCLESVARLAVAEGQMERAVRLLGCASQIYDELGTQPRSSERAEYDQMLDVLRSEVSSPLWEVAWEAGRAMTVDEAIDNALHFEITLLDEPASAPLFVSVSGGLSKRQLEVLHLITEGHSNQEIATMLFISQHADANHVASILNKLGVSSRTAAVASATRQGII